MKKYVSYLVVSLFLILSVLTLNNYLHLVRYHLFIKKINFNISDLPRDILILSASVYDSIIMTGSSVNSWLDQKFLNQKKISKNKIQRINLRVSKNSIKEMASNLPNSAKEKYYPAVTLICLGTNFSSFFLSITKS